MTENIDCRFTGHVTNAAKPETEIESGPEVVNGRLHAKMVSVNAHLQATALWNEFYNLGTEMIVTKAGR